MSSSKSNIQDALSSLGLSHQDEMPQSSFTVVNWSKQDYSSDAIQKQRSREEQESSETFFPTITSFPLNKEISKTFHSLSSSLLSSSRVTCCVTTAKESKSLLSKKKRKTAFVSAITAQEFFANDSKENESGRSLSISLHRPLYRPPSSVSSFPPIIPFSCYHKVIHSAEIAQVEQGGFATGFQPPSRLSSPSNHLLMHGESLSQKCTSANAGKRWFSALPFVCAQKGDRIALVPSMIPQSSIMISHGLENLASSARPPYAFPSSISPLLRDKVVRWCASLAKEMPYHDSISLFAQNVICTVNGLIGEAHSFGIQPWITFLSFELLSLVFSQPLLEELLAILVQHVYLPNALATHPLVPFHMHCNLLQGNLNRINVEHHNRNLVMKSKASAHNSKCARWQSLVERARVGYDRSFMSMIFKRWRLLNQQFQRRHILARRFHRQRERKTEQVQKMLFFLAWRECAAASALHTLTRERFSLCLISNEGIDTLAKSVQAHKLLKYQQKECIATLLSLDSQLEHGTLWCFEQKEELMVLSEEVDYSKSLASSFRSLCTLFYEQLQLSRAQLEMNCWLDAANMSITDSSDFIDLWTNHQVNRASEVRTPSAELFVTCIKSASLPDPSSMRHFAKTRYLVAHFRNDPSYYSSLSSGSGYALTSIGPATTSQSLLPSSVVGGDLFPEFVNLPAVSTAEELMNVLIENSIDGCAPILSTAQSVNHHQHTRSRVPQSPLVQAFAQTVSAISTQPPSIGQFSFTVPSLPILCDREDSYNSTPREKPTDILQKRKKPALTIEINTTRATPLPAQALSNPAEIGIAESKTNAANKSRNHRQRFHRSQELHHRAILLGSVLGNTERQMDNALDDSDVGKLNRGADAAETHPMHVGHSQTTFMSQSISPGLANFLAQSLDRLSPQSPYSNLIKVDCAFHNGQLFDDKGLFLLPVVYSTLTPHPYVERAMEAVLSQAQSDHDMVQAGMFWLLLAFPGLVSRSCEHIPTSMQQAEVVIENISYCEESEQLKQASDFLEQVRHFFKTKRDSAYQSHLHALTSIQSASKVLSARLIARIHAMAVDSGTMQAQQAAEELEAIHDQSIQIKNKDDGLAHHSRWSSTSMSTQWNAPESLAVPHHRSRSSTVFRVSPLNNQTTSKPSYQSESYTRIRSALQQFCQMHQPPSSLIACSSSQPQVCRTCSRSDALPLSKNNMDGVKIAKHKKASADLPSLMPIIAERTDKEGVEFFSSQSVQEHGSSGIPSLPRTTPVLSASYSTRPVLQDDALSVHKCERVLGHFHADLRRIFRHAIDMDFMHVQKQQQQQQQQQIDASLQLTTGKNGSEPSVMTGLQWLRFTRLYKLGSTSFSYHSIDELYARKLSVKQGVYESVMNRSGSIDALHFDDFIELLTAVAMEAYRDTFPLSARLFQLFTEVLFPRAQTMDSLREEMSVSNVHLVLDKHQAWMLSIFAAYATCSSTSNSLLQLHLQYSLNVHSLNTVEESNMSWDDFLEFMRDTELSLSEDVITHLFQQCQMDIINEDYFAGDTLLSYQEFQEALCAVSCYTRLSPFEAIECKLDGLLFVLQNSQLLENRRHKHAILAVGSNVPN